MTKESPQHIIVWQTKGPTLCISLDDHGTPHVEYMVPQGASPPRPVSKHFSSASLPLTSLRIAGEGNTVNKTAKSMIGSEVSFRMRYISHAEKFEKDTHILEILTVDDVSGLEVQHYFRVFDGVPVVRSWSTVTNTSQQQSVCVKQLSSLTIGGLTTGTSDWSTEYSVLFAQNTWFRECQWHEKTLSEAGVDRVGLLELEDGHRATMARFSVSNHGSMSTEGHLAMGALKQKDDKDTCMWQIEHNGSWRWEIGDWQDGVYVSMGGPTFSDHHWSVNLGHNESFTSVPVAWCHVGGSLDDAFAAMTEYRRHIVRPHPDYEKLSIIFNDYMNCLMGDPDEAKIEALLDPVARCGAEYFVIDAGWYADDGNWWNDVGAWEPSKKRFPSGFKTLLDKIRAKGLTPGVWLEPEVVGTRSPLGKQLPEEAFFQECGKRVEERGRYQLDFSRPVVQRHMDGIVDRLVQSYGVGYFKFDYNIDVATGTDANGTSTGAAHLAHQRAYLAWVKRLLDRHSGLVIENCSSGAQRMDYAMLSVHTLQSTSDQQNPLLYAPIAAASPTL